MSTATTGAPAEARRALLSASKPLSVREIFAQCDSALSTTEVASLMHAELCAGRVERTGEKRHYLYTLTDAGRAFAKNPGLLRSRANRRVHGRSKPPLPTSAVPSEPASDDHDESPTQPDGLDAAGWIDRTVIEDSITNTPAALALVPQKSDDDDRSVRLAASVLANWPTPIRTMPNDLLQSVRASLAPIIAA